jgi:Tfp pilus assembly protein PilN
MSSVMAEPVAEETPMAVFDAPAYAAPSVNLLPPEIGQRRALRKLQAGLAAGVVAAAAVVGLLYVQAGSGKSEAQARLNAANTQKVILGAQTSSLAHVSAEKAKIDAARASLKSAMGSEVLWSKTLDDLRLRLPDGVRYQSVAVSAVVAPTAGVATPAPVVGAATVPSNVIATVVFNGVADDMNHVALELDQLALVPGLSNVYLTSATKGATPGSGSSSSSTGGSDDVSFVASANITNSVLSHRYDNLTGGSQ